MGTFENSESKVLSFMEAVEEERKIQEAEDAFRMSDDYKLKVLNDEEKKAKLDEFWNNVEVGKMYTGTVTSLSEYGAFVDINGVVQGLLHISEMTWERDKKPKDILEVGQEIKVKVKEVDKENKRLKLIYDKKGPDPREKVEEKYKLSDVIPVISKSDVPIIKSTCINELLTPIFSNSSAEYLSASLIQDS